MKFLFVFLMLTTLLFAMDLAAQKQAATQLDWSVAGELPSVEGQTKNLGVAGPVAGIHNNVLLVGGGANFQDAMPWLGGKKKYHDAVYIFRKIDNKLESLATQSLPFTIAYAATCTTPQGVFAAGGENESGLRKEAFLMQWDEERQQVVVKPLPALPFAVTNASAVCVNNQVYVAGGERVNDVAQEIITLDLSNTAAGWKVLPSLPQAVSHAVLLSATNDEANSLYLIGGRKRAVGSTSDLYKTVFEFNLQTEKWKEKSSLPYALSAGTGATINDNQLLVFGGDAGETFHKAEALIAAIARETDGTNRKELNEEKIRVQSTHPGFCRQVFQYNIKKDRWQQLDCIPFATPVTTTAVVWGEQIFIPSGEIKAGVRSPQILSATIK